MTKNYYKTLIIILYNQEYPYTYSYYFLLDSHFEDHFR